MARKSVPKPSEDLNLNNIVNAQFRQAASFLREPQGLLDQIEQCDNVFQVNFPVKFGNRISPDFSKIRKSSQLYVI